MNTRMNENKTKERNGSEKRSSRGFTLLEIVILVAILSILASIAVPNLARARQNAEDARTEKELQGIYTAIVMFEAFNGRKPISWAELDPYIRIPNAATKYELNVN